MRLAITAALGVLGACASNNKVDISDEEYDDIAISLATTARTGDGGGELPSITDAITLARGGVVRDFVVSQFEPNVFFATRAAVGYQLTLACRDANGTALDTCSALTDSADATLVWSGELPVPYTAAVESRTGKWTLRDVAGTDVIVNGPAAIAYTTEYANQTRGVIASYEITTSVTYRNLELVPESPWPIAGEIRGTVAAKSKRARENVATSRRIELPVALVFDPSNHVTLDLDDARRVYDLDLATGALVRTGGLEGDGNLPNPDPTP